MDRLVLRRDVGGVAVLTLNRPDKLNALSAALFLQLREQVEALSTAAGHVRCVVLRAEGRAFCAGLDLKDMETGVSLPDLDFRSRTIELLGSLPQPIIAAVQGHCNTGGMELALAADIIMAAESAMFRDTHALLGLIPRWGMSVRLPRRVGLAAAKRLSLTAATVNSAEALRIGLCDAVVPDAALDAFALETAARIAEADPGAVAAIARLYEEGLALPIAAALRNERAQLPLPRKESL